MMKKYKFEEIADEIEEKITQELYKPGYKLPSVRELKAKYNTSISTIQRAYECLLIKDMVRSEPKSGYYVKRKSNPISKISSGFSHHVIIRDAYFENNLSKISSMQISKNVLSEFNVAQPGDFFIPQKLILRTMQQVIREKGASLLRYYPSNGSEKLREQISERAASHQTHLNPSELIITDGALQALYIALSCICMPGDVVAIESPCVFSVLEVLRIQKLKVIEIPVDIQDGFDIDHLKKACSTTQIKAVLITPNFHNPTGCLLSDEQKKSLLYLIQEKGIPLIENDIYGDLHYSGQRPATIRSFDQSGLVLTYSSYSKSLASGLRLGWLSAGQYFEKAEQIKYTLGSTVSPVYQETILKLISTTSYYRHCRQLRNQLARQSFHTHNLLTEFFPKLTRFSFPSGGSNIWVKMDERTDMELFYKQCETIGVRFTPGYTFSYSNIYNHFFRIVFFDKYSVKREDVIKLAGKAASEQLAIW